MPDTGLKRSPKFQKGALLQLVKDVVGVVPNVIPFQYNPEQLSRSPATRAAPREKKDDASKW